MGLLHDPQKVEYILVPRLGPHPQLTMYLQNYDGINQIQEQGFNVSDRYSCTTYDFPNVPFLNSSIADLYSPLLQLTLKTANLALPIATEAYSVGVKAFDEAKVAADFEFDKQRAQADVLNKLFNETAYNQRPDKLGNFISPQANYETSKRTAIQATNESIAQGISKNTQEFGKQVIDQIAQLNKPAQIQSRGTVGGQWMQSYVFSVNLCRYEISQLRLIKQYVERYGLSCYSIINKWAPERQRFDYVECQDIIINGDIPQEAKAYISQMFTEGVMFWHDDNLFDYSNNGDA